MTVNEVIEARCRQSRELARLTERLAPTIKPCCRRHDFAVCAVDLALEHHRAIVRLMDVGEIGAAAALFRPLIEAAAAAFWLVYAAADGDVLALPTDPKNEAASEDVPMLGEMATALLPYFPAMATLINGLARKGDGAARWLHKYTHGGTPQLARRDRTRGWTEADVILGLIRADLFAMTAASVLTVIHGDDAFRAHVFGTRDELSKELSATFEIAVPDDQPHHHPAPNKSCCGEPLFAA